MSVLPNTIRNLNSFLYPKSVAIVGASRSPEKLGSIVLDNIIKSDYKGQIYPINPGAESIQDLKCYKDLTSLPETPELVVIAVPSSVVLEILIQAGEKGVRNAVVFAAGYKEAGSDGAKMETDLIKTAEKYQINLLGPNCLGFVNTNCPINATFGSQVKNKGNLRFISQSGAIAASLFDWCDSTGLGLSDLITLGNKAVLNENDFLNYYYDLSQNTLISHHENGLSSVNPIGLYLESISNGAEFLKVASKISKKDPIFILKPGKTGAAALAMHSHTGAIAGEDSVLEAALQQAGVIRCQTMEDFFDLSRAFAWEEVPQGPRVAVISNAGGPAVISADAVVTSGLELAQFDAQTKEELLKVLPRSASILDPVDVLGDALADRYAQAAEIILKKDNADALIVLLTPQIMTQISKTAELVGALAAKYHKPIFCSFIGGSLVAEGEKKLNELMIPSFRFPERAIYAISKMWQFKKRQLELEKPATASQPVVLSQEIEGVRGILQQAVNEKYSALDNISADKIISSVGVPTPATQYITTIEEANAFASQYGWPVVLKLSSPGLLHKKEIGGVIVDIMNAEQLDDAFHKITRKIDQLDSTRQKTMQVQIQKQVQSGVQVIIGIKTDPTFGSVLLFGAGGSYAELIADRNLHLLPIEISQAKELVAQSKVFNLLKGSKSDPPYALDKLYEVIVRVSKLAVVVPEASEIEINPVIVTINDVWAVDSKVVMKQEPENITPSPKGPKLLVANTLSAETLASQFHHYKFEAEQPLNFKPGQYISVKVAKDAIRAYSIATRYSSTKFDLLVDTRPGGPGSKFFETLKAGDKMTYLGPFGVFTFNKEDGAENYLFLATGSGASAVRCMIDVALQEEHFTKPLVLYLGLTFVEEIFWKDHFDELAKKYPNFSYKIALFKPDATWTGYKGFITELVKQDFPDASKCAAYLCGHRAMISDATDLLIQNGCPKERVYTERFV